MRFEEILPIFREGKKIRRKIWPSDCYFKIVKVNFDFAILDEEGKLAQSSLYRVINSDDWEIVEEPEPKEVIKEVLNNIAQSMKICLAMVKESGTIGDMTLFNFVVNTARYIQIKIQEDLERIENK